MDKTNTWLNRVFAFVFICVCLIAYLINTQKKTSLLLSKPSIENLEYKAFLLRPKPNIEDLEYKTLDKKRTNAEFAANRDYANYEKVGSKNFVMLHSIVGLNQQTIQNKWNYIFLEKKQIYQNGILL